MKSKDHGFAFALIGVVIFIFLILTGGIGRAAEPRPILPTFDVAYVNNSPGGVVADFIALKELFRSQGTRVEVSGYCASACTLFLGLDNVCYRPGARFGFHAPYYMTKVEGVRIYVNDETAEMLAMYPQPIQDWIKANGGLKAEPMLWLEGDDLAKLVPACLEVSA